MNPKLEELRQLFRLNKLLLLSILFITYKIHAEEHAITVITKDSTYHLSELELKKGERLFFGILEPLTKEESCASCHYTHAIDTLNWNPSVLDLAQAYQNKSFEDFKNALLNPLGKKMTEVHTGYELTQEEVVWLKAFVDKYAQTNELAEKPVITNLVFFIVLVLLFFAASVDLIFIHLIKWRFIVILTLLVTTVLITRYLVVESINLGRQPNYAPLQPIKFSHKVHAGINGTDCLYCHHTAEYSKSAGIPSLNVCWNCHQIVREGTHSGKFEINKLVHAYENNIPVEWIRVHNLPDHVFFSHAQHVGAGKLDCEECHGEVEDMTVLRQYSELSMGWCLECHRTRKVQFIANEYYEIFEEYHEDLVHGEIDSVLVNQIGGEDCMKCHY